MTAPTNDRREVLAAVERIYAEHGHPDDWGVQVIYLGQMLERLDAALAHDGDDESRAVAGEVWQEADNVLLLCIEPGGRWRDFRGADVPWDAPLIARPLRRLLDADGNLVRDRIEAQP